MKKYGVNPNLIALMTGQKLADIPRHPTVANLPGTLAKIVGKNMSKILANYVKNPYRLQCAHCGKTGEYNLGTVALDGEGLVNCQQPDGTDMIENIQAAAYFRCKHCNGAGKWKLTSTGAVMLNINFIKVMMLAESKKNKWENQFVIGTILVDGNFKPHWGTDAEDYFLSKLTKDPQNAYCWNRLANCLYKNGRADLAAAIFEHSLQIDNMQMESNFSLGKILYEIEMWKDAAGYLRQTLMCAHQYENMKALIMRDMLVNTLEFLFEIHEFTGGAVAPLPTGEELALINSKIEPKGKNGKVIALMDFEIFPGNPETLFPVAELFMGKRREEIPAEYKRLKVPEFSAKSKLDSARKVDKLRKIINNEK